jgi:glutamyl-tRNA synthetase
VEEFSIERVNKHGARYDFDKLKWFNQQYLRHLSDQELAEKVTPILAKNGITQSPEFIQEVCRLMKERWSFIQDVWPSTTFFFHDPTTYDEQVVAKKWKDQVPTLINHIQQDLHKVVDWNAASIENSVKETCTAHGVGTGVVLQALRLTVSGEGAGPAMFEMCALLGKDTVINRIQKAIQVLNA